MNNKTCEIINIDSNCYGRNIIENAYFLISSVNSEFSSAALVESEAKYSVFIESWKEIILVRSSFGKPGRRKYTPSATDVKISIIRNGLNPIFEVIQPLSQKGDWNIKKGRKIKKYTTTEIA